MKNKVKKLLQAYNIQTYRECLEFIDDAKKEGNPLYLSTEQRGALFSLIYMICNGKEQEVKDYFKASKGNIDTPRDKTFEEISVRHYNDMMDGSNGVGDSSMVGNVFGPPKKEAQNITNYVQWGEIEQPEWNITTTENEDSVMYTIPVKTSKKQRKKIERIQKCFREKEIEHKSFPAKKETDGKPDYGLLDWDYIDALSKRMDNGGKYPKDNWKKDIDIKELAKASMRHARKILQQTDNDPESLNDHAEALGCNGMMIFYQLNKS